MSAFVVLANTGRAKIHTKWWTGCAWDSQTSKTLPIGPTEAQLARKDYVRISSSRGHSHFPRCLFRPPIAPNFVSYLLDVLLHPQVRRVHQRTHDLHVAVDHQGFVGAIRVDADPAVVKHGVGELGPLPEHVAVALKLPGVGGLGTDGDVGNEKRW